MGGGETERQMEGVGESEGETRRSQRRTAVSEERKNGEEISGCNH